MYGHSKVPPPKIQQKGRCVLVRRQTIQDLHVAVKRGTLLSGETKDDEVHRGSDAHRVFRSRTFGMS
jgi:hypothetical protein